MFSKNSIYRSILAVVETWLADDIIDGYMYHDYQQFAVSRHRQAFDGQGGGVMLLFHPRYRVLRQTIPVALTSCDAVAVVYAQDGHCWVLAYLPDSRDVSSVTQVCVFLDIVTPHVSNHNGVFQHEPN